MACAKIEAIVSQKNQKKIVCLTAYTASMAKILAPHVDVLLVGDSVGMVVYGMQNTLGVTVDMMIAHGKGVMRGVADLPDRPCVVIDMPYGSYESSVEDGLANARRLIDETGADAVKLEGGQDMAPVIEALVKADIPVMGHIGLQPQSVEKEGGYKIKGRDEAGIAQLIADGKAVEKAGVFSVVVEGTFPEAAQQVSRALSIPTIGIGASPDCDGQVLVIDDMLGLHTGHVPKFVKQYQQLHGLIDQAASAYAADVRAGAFPSEAYLYRKKAS